MVISNFVNFYPLQKVLLIKLVPQLYRVFDNNYINEEKLKYLVFEYEKLSIKIHNFITYLNKKDFKGTKFIDPQSPPSNP
jgi:hypothetical protein